VGILHPFERSERVGDEDNEWRQKERYMKWNKSDPTMAITIVDA
jgi:hypothetical protein